MKNRVTRNQLRQRRERMPDSLRTIKATQLLYQADSLLTIAKAIIPVKDRLIQEFAKPPQLKVLKQELKLNKSLKETHKSFRKEMRLRRKEYALIHRSNSRIEKLRMRSALDYIHSQSKVNKTGPIEGAYQNQNLAYDTMRVYSRLIKSALNAVKKSHSLAYKSPETEEKFERVKQDYNSEMTVYKKEMSSYLIKKGRFIRILEREAKRARKLVDNLKEDDKLENKRYRRYRDYRRRQRDTEISRLRKIQSELKKHRKLLLH